MPRPQGLGLPRSSARIRLTIVWLAAMAASACGGASGADLATRADSAGITIVRSTGSDQPAPVVLTEQFRLGGNESRPGEAFHQVNQSVVGTDSHGNIHVLDASAYHVHSFDNEGRYLRTVGGQGGGPGELGMPFGLVVEPNGTVGVVDIAKRALVRFGPDGEIVEPLPLPSQFRGGHLVADGDVMLVPSMAADHDGRMASLVIRTTPTDTTELVRMLMPEMKPVQLPSCGMSFSGMAPVFSPTLRWAAAGNRIAVARGDTYDIEVFDNGESTLRVRRDIAPQTATTALAVEQQGEGMRVGTEAGYATCEAREVVDRLGTAPTIPVTDQMAIAPDGTIWVRRGGVRDHPRAVDLFASDGTYLGTLPQGSPFPVAFFPDGRMAAGETDALDVTRLVVYQVDRP